MTITATIFVAEIRKISLEKWIEKDAGDESHPAPYLIFTYS
jgi:hypothetical protein